MADKSEYEWVLEEVKGGPGSGNWGHRGRPGSRGGSTGGGFSASLSAGITIIDPDSFVESLDEHIDRRYEAFVTRYKPNEYQEMGAKCYTTKDGRGGYAIKPDGDIISVFAERDSDLGPALVFSAKENGGTKLDCFDGKLPGFYDRFGFKEYDRWTWNDQYAPPNWNYKKFGKPDVVFMSLSGKGD